MNTLRSMTAFGRASEAFDKGTIAVEIQSINRRFLELNFQLPRGFARFEPFLRKRLSLRLGRGAVHISVTFVPNSILEEKVVPNLALAKGLQQAWQTIATTLGVKDEFSLSFLTHERELFSRVQEADEEAYLEVLERVCDRALEQLLAMKEAEGAVLGQDVLARLECIMQHSSMIGLESHVATESYRKKLLERMEGVLGKSLEVDERLLKEIALFAEKVDISEELVRLGSHVQTAKALLTSVLSGDQETKGKTIEFLIQEIMRESNTIGSKVLSVTVANLVIAIKAELEKIKEQSQNIE